LLLPRCCPCYLPCCCTCCCNLPRHPSKSS
jgi:hypothetical protein